MATRRTFLRAAGALTAASPTASARAASPVLTLAVPLSGTWRFRTGPDAAWRGVRVPHTWQVEPALAGHHGSGWYERQFTVAPEWAGHHLRLEFEAAYHTATIWINDAVAGTHAGRGYTAFTVDITRHVRPGANTVRVQVDNSFSDTVLPRGTSYDWAPDGGLTRPVWLRVTPPVFLESLVIDAVPEVPASRARLGVRAIVRNATAQAARVEVGYEVVLESAGFPVVTGPSAVATVPAHSAAEVRLPDLTVADPALWHFDHPNLYRLRARCGAHRLESTFGIRTFAVKDSSFMLNGEPVRLAGVERMAGSHPQHGMAESLAWIEHDHRDLQELNCVFTRVHWPQDHRVLDYCDRHGILLQVELPVWGGKTFEGMSGEPAAWCVDNALAQLTEMIARDRHHPSVVAWGLANEINGHNPVAQKFVRRLFAEARRLDPRRLLTYASNTLQEAPMRDIAGEMDFISWNEYYESWYSGTVEDVRRNLGEIVAAFPGKPIVISEYGYCECAPGRDGGDAARIGILRNHNRIFRENPAVGGLIFFCYNDYRTHIGDKGAGVLKQRVHGVVDLYGERKPSFDELRRESSPVETLAVEGSGLHRTARIRTRRTIPAYTLRGYRLRWTGYGFGDLPMEQGEIALPDLVPGAASAVEFDLQSAPRRLRVEVVRPLGLSAQTLTLLADKGQGRRS